MTDAERIIAPIRKPEDVDAESTMLNLGFRPTEASASVNAANDEIGDGATLDAPVRLPLKKAAK